jgi:hypothetical protein
MVGFGVVWYGGVWCGRDFTYKISNKVWFGRVWCGEVRYGRDLSWRSSIGRAPDL